LIDFFGIPEDEVRLFGVDFLWGLMDRAIAGTRDALSKKEAAK
jgi:hypothetical protein